MILYLKKEIMDAWGNVDPFIKVQQQQGEIFREKEGRRTLQFAVGDKYYFLKLHQGVGWSEIIKNLLQLRLPIISASNEWLAIKKLHQLGVYTMTVVGYGRRGLNPARQVSFIITEALVNTINLMAICENWSNTRSGIALKHALILKIATIARTLHENGINHRDFYLCHFLVDASMGKDNINPENLRLYVIDLHRAQIRRRTPLRWIIKDLGGLYFSAMDTDLTARDILRFMTTYSKKNVRELAHEQRFWMRVHRHARRIYRRDFGNDMATLS